MPSSLPGGGLKKTGQAALVSRPAPAVLEGMVVRTESGFHRVRTDDGQIIVCRAPKRLLLGERVATTAVVIGDRVRVHQSGDKIAIVDEILERRNELVRGAAGGSRYLDVIAANLDLLITVHSLAEPELVRARLDRFVLIAEAAEIPALVCLNKLDLVEQDWAEAAAAPYRAAGYPVILSSTKTGAGIGELQSALHDKLSALVGPSG